MERQKLNTLALREYEETGKLSGQKLREACADFEQKVTWYVATEEEEDQILPSMDARNKEE